MIGDQTFNVDSSKGTLVVNPSKQNKKQLISPRYEPIVTGFVLAASVQRENLDLPAFLQELDLRGHHYSSEVRYYLMWSDIQRHAVSIHFLCREFWILSKLQPKLRHSGHLMDIPCTEQKPLRHFEWPGMLKVLLKYVCSRHCKNAETAASELVFFFRIVLPGSNYLSLNIQQDPWIFVFIQTIEMKVVLCLGTCSSLKIRRTIRSKFYFVNHL